MRYPMPCFIGRSMEIAFTFHLGVAVISVLLPRPLFAEPVDVGAEIPGPPAAEAAASLGSDWIRTPLVETEKLETSESMKLERQRGLVDQIARQGLGERLTRTTNDLRTIQRILDQKLLGDHPNDTLHALGVALGDVLVEEQGFHWIGFVDEDGRSLALRQSGSDHVIFPVTAIARRVEAGGPVDVTKLYAEMTARR
jgi:hypothetical protein